MAGPPAVQSLPFIRWRTNIGHRSLALWAIDAQKVDSYVQAENVSEAEERKNDNSKGYRDINYKVGHTLLTKLLQKPDVVIEH